MKRVVLIAAVAGVLVIGGWFGVQALEAGAASSEEIETAPAQRGDLTVTAEANGVVRARQTAVLTWKTSGSVEDVYVNAGEAVSAGQTLAVLDQTSLPQALILAQTDLAQARRDLETLLESQVQKSQARLAVEQAQKALEDARSPDLVQAEAQEAVTAAQSELEDAQRALAILESPPPASALEQTHANLLLAENVLNKTLKDIERVEKKLKKPKEAYLFFESRELYRELLGNLEMKRARDQRSYEDALNKYNRLLAPPDPTDLALARANLARAEAQLAQAERKWERVKDGLSPGELAMQEAQLADAEREWERVKDGPDPQDIAAAEARVAAAQAAISLVSITAPFEGVITEVASRAGDQAAPGTPAFRLDDLSRLLVEAQVAEVDINRIQLGQPAILTFEAAPGKQYRGEVVELPAVGEAAQGIVVFNVLVELGGEDGAGGEDGVPVDDDVKPGMTSSVTIVTDELKDVLLVPSQAVRWLEGQRVVFVLRGGRAVPIAVTLGLSANNLTQVVEGNLQPGDAVILNPNNELLSDLVGGS